MKLAWSQILISLLIGIIVGFGLSSWKCMQCPCQHKAFHKGQIIERLTAKLELKEEQKAQVAALFEKKHEKMKELRDQTKEEIKSVLSEEQAKKFDELIKKCKAFKEG